MGCLDLTIKVINISPKSTKEDLRFFFSYCGTIQDINLKRGKDQSQVALVKFRQPYAFQTALLLDGANIGDQKVHIIPLDMKDRPISTSDSEETSTKGTRNGGNNSFSSSINELLLEVQLQAQAGKQREGEMIGKAKVLVNYTGEILTRQASSVANEIGSSIANKECISKGAVWLSEALDKASKNMAQLAANPKLGDSQLK